VVAVAASAVLVLPVAWWFETLSIVRAFGESLGLGPEGYLANLRGVLSHLLRHEFLAPALLCRVAVVLADRRTGRDRDAAYKDGARGTAAFLLAFAGGYVLIGCLNPLVYERYFMVLSPLLTASFLIDAFTLTDLAPALAPTRRRAAALTAGALALVGVAAVAGRAPSVMGRLAEITVRYRGPLDFAIPHLASSYPHPEELVIATNYESHPFVYYLGAHLIVGLNMNNLVADRALDPDVVIVRRRWPRAQQELKRFLAKGTYLSEDLPVRDLHYNNVPALSRSPSTPDPHRFRTALAVKPAQRLRIYRKAEGVSSSRPGG
jgi:hypothetical protein